MSTETTPAEAAEPREPADAADGPNASRDLEAEGEPKSGWKRRVSENRRRIDVELAGRPDVRARLSPVLAGLTRELTPRLTAHAKGRFLDAGCGTQPFRALVEPQVDRYLTFDIEARVDEVDYIGDIEDMSAVPTGSIDSMLCSEVLEHVPHPERAMAEFHRILKPGGVVVLTVPFMARLHEEPHDYYRYTRHGVRRLFDDAGFDLDDIVETGSLCSFVGHQVSLGVLGLTWHIPGLGKVAAALNHLFVVRPSAALDRITGMGRLLPLGYVAVARKRS
jgi:SAM-dependent methyltransferase